MDFMSSLSKGGDAKNQPAGEEKSSSSDIFMDAKVVAEAARAQFNNQPEKCDKAKAAGSAADLLDAVSDYGKLEESKGVGKYVEQAEGYLRQYSAPKSTPAPASGEEKPAPPTTGNQAEAEIPSGGGAGDHVKKPEEPAEGEYLKKAEELLAKPSHGGEKGESEGGYGDLMKAAGGFFNK